MIFWFYSFIYMVKPNQTNNDSILAMLNDDGRRQHIQYSDILMGLISGITPRQ